MKVSNRLIEGTGSGSIACMKSSLVFNIQSHFPMPSDFTLIVHT
jgi:hypothetical protein